MAKAKEPSFTLIWGNKPKSEGAGLIFYSQGGKCLMYPPLSPAEDFILTQAQERAVKQTKRKNQK